MNKGQLYEFKIIVDQCKSSNFNSINVASITRREAIVAVWNELWRLQAMEQMLLEESNGRRME